MLEDLIGVVYSRKEGRVLCLEGSKYYNDHFKDKKDDNIGIRYIHFTELRRLMWKNCIIEKWNIDDLVLENDLSSYLPRIEKCMEKEDRKDALFRSAVVTSQLDISKYLTHDPVINPNARPHGSKEDEVMSYGQLFVQAFALAQLRGVNVKKAIEIALRNWEDADWRKRKGNNNGDIIKGLSNYIGSVTGNAFLDPYCRRLEELDGGIIVTRHAKADTVHALTRSLGIVTDEGGLTCHVANIAREYNLPFVVGTGDATKRIKDGQKIKIESKEGDNVGLVYLL